MQLGRRTPWRVSAGPAHFHRDSFRRHGVSEIGSAWLTSLRGPVASLAIHSIPLLRKAAFQLLEQIPGPDLGALVRLSAEEEPVVSMLFCLEKSVPGPSRVEHTLARGLILCQLHGASAGRAAQKELAPQTCLGNARPYIGLGLRPSCEGNNRNFKPALALGCVSDTSQRVGATPPLIN